MKKVYLILVVAVMATVFFTACGNDEPHNNGGGNDPNTPAKIGVLINGVVWSPYNVGAAGKFVSKAEDYGGLYQWNRKDTVGFLLYDDYYASNFSTATSWLSVNDPSPAGWRVPTSAEIETLFESDKVKNEWIEQNGVFGRKFTDLSTNKSIFMPAAGYVDGFDGIFYYSGEYGFYWNNTVFEEDSDRAYALIFNSDIAGCGNGIKANTSSVRPVAK